LIVVDNGHDDKTREIVQESWGSDFEYVAPTENLGPAGGFAVGMRAALETADDADWLLMLDDNDPPPTSTSIAELRCFADTAVALEPLTAGVGLGGPRWDPRRGRMAKIPDEHLHGLVEVEYFGAGRLPMYRAGVIRKEGVAQSELFFGFEELELALRLRRGGYHLYASGAVMRRRRASEPKNWDKPSVALSRSVSWRDWYAIRNFVYVQKRYGRLGAALRYAVIAGLVKPLLSLPRSPRRAIQHMAQSSRAASDGFRGRLGRTVDPPY